jgi:tryptophan synthase beta chain
MNAVIELEEAYKHYKDDPEFNRELTQLLNEYAGRPSRLYYARRMTQDLGGANIYLKREDLNHTGAHKLNHCMGEGLLAKYMGKKKLIAETGAGQHGVALATAAAYFGLECDIYMGEVDIAKQAPNVTRMKLLGANVVPVSFGLKTLKEAVDAAFMAYSREYKDAVYCIGTAAGPHPFPLMVRDFQFCIGEEARAQFVEQTGHLPDQVAACVGGGSNSIGMFTPFLADPVELIGVEPLGRGPKLGDHAASINYGTEGIMHGFKSIMLADENGDPAPVYSNASGLDYPAAGPEHALLHKMDRVKYTTVDDDDAIEALFLLSRHEGIIPAIESSHALAYAIRVARTGATGSILVNLSGRGDKDLDFVVEKYGYGDEFLEKLAAKRAAK